ncbi:MAG: glycine oxidase ThiO, partial [Mariprofundaceae bacterium]|nr:glycine oxidase ThiO [Mariprofundaceae bacterium]
MRVVVIGAGIIGLLTGLRLKQQGVDVLILEKSKVGQESSWAGAGILCPIHPWLYPDIFTDLVNASLDLYPALEAELQRETGHDIQRMQSGLLIPCFATDKIQHQTAAELWSRKFGWNMQRLNAEEAREKLPILSSDISEALYWQDVCQVRNPELLTAVLLYLRQLEVPIVEQCEVEELLEDGVGHVVGVRTFTGQKYDADAVLLAAGSWSAALAEQAGFTLPVQPVKGQIVLLKSEVNTLQHIVKHDDVYLVPRRDGRILVGASMEHVGFQRGNTQAVLQSLLDATYRLLPELEKAEIEHQWMGFRPGSPDGLPFLGKVKSKQGLWVATGHYRNGVALAPITEQIMA